MKIMEKNMKQLKGKILFFLDIIKKINFKKNKNYQINHSLCSFRHNIEFEISNL